MISIWNLIQAVLGTWWVTSPLLGWLGSVVVTQTYKRQALRRKWMDADNLATVAWILAVITGFAFTAWTAPLFQGVDPPAVLLAAVLTGLWSPFAFKLFQAFLRASPELGKKPGWGWLPDLTPLADWLSADQSGKVE